MINKNNLNIYIYSKYLFFVIKTNKTNNYFILKLLKIFIIKF